MTEITPLVVKVADGPDHAYFVHFDRVTLELIDVREYRKIYVPAMGVMAKRTDTVVRVARDKVGKPITQLNKGELQ